MNPHDLFNAGTVADIVPKGDTARQAVDSLRGYAYQALATALAWLDIDEHGKLFLEVAEDYALIANQALDAVQVKDTQSSESITLNRPSVRNAVAAFVDLTERNPTIQVDLRFFTTSEIGTEQAIADRPAGIAGLEYWRRVAAGADPSPLRTILESDRFPESVREFSKARNDDAALRRDLIERIHWDCGKPDFSTLRQELESRLVVVGRDRFNLPAPEARRLADFLVYRVLEKSIIKTPEDRVLTRADLYSEIDAATRTSVPRASIDALTRLASGLAGSFGGGLGTGNPLSITETGWLIDGTMLPVPQGIIARSAVESAVADAVDNSGVGVLVGGSGLGKSIVSRAVAAARAGAFFIVDFRNTDADETCRRLDILFARVGGLPPSALILEDLNHIDDTRVTLSLARVVEALRRRYRKALITCYQQPSLKTLTEIGLNRECVVNCPYFSAEEVHALILNNGGDPARWGPLAYLAGACGHPQLTHAFVIGVANRGWPDGEIEAVVSRGLSSDDTETTRKEARRNLVAALPEGTRNLLYRLSIATGRFNRSLALTIGEVSPAVSQAGECLDQLVGPWLEAVGGDAFRVSPLARSFGPEMLSPDEQRRIHETIAVQMIGKGTIEASDFDTIMMHAIAGKMPQILAMLGLSILLADSPVEKLAEHILFLRFCRTDVPIYPEEPLASGLLRLTQFKLAATTDGGNNISAIAAALFNEIDSLPVPAGEIGRALEAMAAFAVLGTMGIANYLDDWVALLLRFKALIEVDEFLQGIVANVESAFNTSGANFFGMLFSVGSAHLASVERLERVINALDKLDADERALLLAPIDSTLSDYSLFINGPWEAQRHSEAFDAADAARRYQRMEEKTRSWGIHPLTLQCSVARAVMLDEYQNNKEGALAVLAEARVSYGDDVILSRAIAKVYYRSDEHGTALEIIRSIADQVGVDDPVERAFALREAAISAAKCDEWSQAEQWFLDAQSAAKLVQVDDMRVMAVGLGADSAVAALETGDVGRALTRLAEAVGALADINPEATLRAAYCHRVIRHTVLWVQSRITRGAVQVGGRPIAMEAGTCSNPDPLPAIRELPLGHVDVAWYMLAETESAAGLDVGITATLDARLAQGPIPMTEVNLRTQTIQTDIARLDTDGFAAHFTKYVESMVYLSKEVARPRAPFDPVAPARGQIPKLVKKGPFDPVAEQVAKDAILAYGICSALADRPEAMTELEAALEGQFSGPFPGKPVFDYWNEKPAFSAELDQTVVSTIKALLQNEPIEPHAFWVAGLRFFEQINQSNFKPFLTPRIAAWLRSGWKRILSAEAFRLSSPRQTVPLIEEVLTISADDSSFIAKLLLAASEAVEARLGTAYRDNLKTIAEETSSPSNVA